MTDLDRAKDGCDTCEGSGKVPSHQGMAGDLLKPWPVPCPTCAHTARHRSEVREECASGIIEAFREHLYRICEKCNKEYQVPLQWTGNALAGLCFNFGDCPNCGERDDVWILLKVDEMKSAIREAGK